MEAAADPSHEIIRTDIPHRLDRLPWSRWHWLIVPRVSHLDNEMAATGGGLCPTAFSMVMRLDLLLSVQLLLIAPGEPGRNTHVESFDALWQDRVLCHP